MSRGRMEAFSDGVLAIVITIMVLKLQAPKSVSLSGLNSLYPAFITYVLSYLYVGIYWTNHHHLLSILDTVSGRILWKNLLWLFFITLIPLATERAGLNLFETLPTIFYGIVLLACSISYIILQNEVVKINGKNSLISKNIGNDIKGKISIIAYVLAVILSFKFTYISYFIYTLVAIIWIVPDKRIENTIDEIQERKNEDI